MTDAAAQLAAIGIIVTPETKSWRMADDNAPVIFAAYVTCWCAGYPRQVAFVPIEKNGRRVLVTQCPDCRGEVVWMYWRMDGQWTGERKITVEDIGGGRGACAQASPITRGAYLPLTWTARRCGCQTLRIGRCDQARGTTGCQPPTP